MLYPIVNPGSRIVKKQFSFVCAKIVMCRKDKLFWRVTCKHFAVAMASSWNLPHMYKHIYCNCCLYKLIFLNVVDSEIVYPSGHIQIKVQLLVKDKRGKWQIYFLRLTICLGVRCIAINWDV